MRTNIVLDDKLLHEAFHYAAVTTQRELIDLVLREFIDNHRRKDLRDLRGKVKLREDYD
jgi:Arc/MetJ family transcription regulator